MSRLKATGLAFSAAEVPVELKQLNPATAMATTQNADDARSSTGPAPSRGSKPVILISGNHKVLMRGYFFVICRYFRWEVRGWALLTRLPPQPLRATPRRLSAT